MRLELTAGDLEVVVEALADRVAWYERLCSETPDVGERSRRVWRLKEAKARSVLAEVRRQQEGGA